MIDKISNGKINKFISENTLLNQKMDYGSRKKNFYFMEKF